MQWTGQPEYRRPFDNGGTSAFNTMGGVGQNEYTIDGMMARIEEIYGDLLIRGKAGKGRRHHGEK